METALCRHKRTNGSRCVPFSLSLIGLTWKIEGKSYWVTYAVRRLGEQKPFLWYRSGVCLLFVSDGAYQQDVKNVTACDFVPFLWAFVDADGSPTGIPGRLTNPYIMFTTCPKQQTMETCDKGFNMCPLLRQSMAYQENSPMFLICSSRRVT
jgi:hypothetical protein